MQSPPIIISASRRTDIPAFYCDWFYQRVQQGFVDVTNPFSKNTYRVSLKPDDVSAIVFWSKDYRPFLSILKKNEPVYKNHFLFHFTITGYQERAKLLFEPNAPDFPDAIQTAKYLSDRYGMETVLWRFDPVIFSGISSYEERLNTFRRLAEELEGIVSRCYISFVDLYGKVQRRFDRLSKVHSVNFIKPTIGEQVEFARELAVIANDYGIEIYTCCEDDVARASGVSKGHCIDAELLQRLYPDRQFTDEIKPTRRGCGCFASKDIGSYNTCWHHCLYCYAN
ncbi:MAG: DUF1848 domain-containing protein [Candidatus Marinimicrobia bacterium]|nr:DUF1848 domain-containing protein [Candidatus Neomarinimicrobiota bacterium]